MSNKSNKSSNKNGETERTDTAAQETTCKRKYQPLSGYILQRETGLRVPENVSCSRKNQSRQREKQTDITTCQFGKGKTHHRDAERSVWLRFRFQIGREFH